MKPVLKQLSATLKGAGSSIRLIYQSTASCNGLSEVATQTGDKTSGSYWDDAGTELKCDVDTTAGHIPDIGLSDVYASTCDGVTVPATGFKDFHGPVQVMTFVAPPSSRESSISAEAASVVYGFGGTGTVVTPWSDKTALFQRPDTSGTRRMIGKAIGLQISKWNGTEKSGSGDVLSAVHTADATNPNGGLGILAADYADTNRAGTQSAVKILAFQPKGSSCALLPDSSSTSFDKVNVRSGKYTIWGALHLLTKVDGAGVPTNPNVKTVINYFTREGLDAAAKKTMIDTEVAAHTIPWCAMNVKRDGEVGDVQSVAYQPEEPCGCYFESKAQGTAPSTCKACTADTECGGSNKCRYGYCEAR
ncbi:hypothetical protein AKJ09_08090 [Labilithrix luteola]|uniref:PBP domain-containing protein n=1 Tax=Labilithrix luteola TaxID=1391654 RepID=A0A0K1Q6Z7_9BACT|nr:hypothetical protein AKJ09_08090 [Labilithrix luteola]